MDLIDARKLKHMTQDEVATALGISRAAYTNIELGKRKPSVPLAMRIGAILEIDWPELFAESNKKADA